MKTEKKGDLVSREAAKEAVKYIPWCDWQAVGRTLDELEAVDAVPVVHGRWIWVKDKEDPNVEHLKCSACMGSGVDEADGYCRHCGAKMDGDGHE